MNKKKLEKYKKLLLEEKTKILEANFNNDTLEHLGVNESGDIVDVASKLYQTDFFLQMADHDKEKLKLIDKALEKIEDGTYGICEGLDKPIEEKRLDALPWTPYCIEYAQSISKRKK